MQQAIHFEEFLNSFNIPKTKETIAVSSYSNALDDLSLALVNYRINHDLTQDDLAKLIGVSTKTIMAYESGDRNLSLKAISNILASLGLEFRLTIG